MQVPGARDILQLGYDQRNAATFDFSVALADDVRETTFMREASFICQFSLICLGFYIKTLGPIRIVTSSQAKLVSRNEHYCL